MTWNILQIQPLSDLYLSCLGSLTKLHFIVLCGHTLHQVRYFPKLTFLLKELVTGSFSCSVIPSTVWKKEHFKSSGVESHNMSHHKYTVMAPHSSTLAWKLPWTEEPGRLQSMGSLGVGHDWAASLSLFTLMLWRRKWQPTPVFLPGESQGWGSLVGCCLWGRTESDTTEAT